MAVLADLIKETTTTTGTGAITLGGAFSVDFRAFYPTIPVGSVVPCVIRGRGTGEWEISEATLTAQQTLARTSVKASSNGGALVNFSAGIKDVSIDLTADLMNGYARKEDGRKISELTATNSFADDDMLVVEKADGSVCSILGSIIKASGGVPADNTGPTLSSPTAAQTGTNTANGSVTTNEATGVLYFLATVNATETVATVKANGGVQAISSVGSKSVSVSGLTAATQYYLHFVHTDASNNDSTRVTSAAFTTAAVADTTAPTLSSPTATKTGQNTATGTVSTNEANGTLYRYVSTNAVESVATVKAANLTQAVTATGVQNLSFSGLTANTTYYAHYVHSDASNNNSTVSSSASFTTDAIVQQTNAQRWSKVEKASFHSLTDPTTFTGSYANAGAPNEYFSQDLKILVVNPSDANDYPAASVLKVVWIRTATGAAAPTALPAQFQWSGSAWPTGVPYEANGGTAGGGNVPNSITTMGHFNVGSYPGVFNLEGSLFGGGIDGDYWPVVLFPDGSFKSMNMKVSVS